RGAAGASSALWPLAPSCDRRYRAPRRSLRRSGDLGGYPPLVQPLADEAAEVGHELLVLVRRIRGAHGLHQQRVEVARADPVEDELVQVAEPARAEVLVAVGLEVLVGHPPVRGE